MAEKFSRPQVGRVRAVPRLFVLYPGIWLTAAGKSTEKTSVMVGFKGASTRVG